MFIIHVSLPSVSAAPPSSSQTTRKEIDNNSFGIKDIFFMKIFKFAICSNLFQYILINLIILTAS